MNKSQPIESKPALYKAYFGKNVIVLGASGFIGRWLARELCRNGAHVFLIIRDRSSASNVFNNYQIDGDIIEINLEEDAASLNEIFQDIKPSITFNLVGYGVDRSERTNDTAYKINADLVSIVCDAVALAKNDSWSGHDIIHVGSALEYGEIGGDLAEDLPPNPTTLYGKSKLEGTRLLIKSCREKNMKGLSVRLFTVYGPGEQYDRLLPSLFDAKRDGRSLQLTLGLQKRDFTYVDDVVEGLLRLGASDAGVKGGIVNLASGQLFSVKDFIKISAKVLSIDDNKLLFGAIPTRNEEMEHLPVSNKQLQQITDWIPSIGIEEGVHRCSVFIDQLQKWARNDLNK